MSNEQSNPIESQSRPVRENRRAPAVFGQDYGVPPTRPSTLQEPQVQVVNHQEFKNQVDTIINLIRANPAHTLFMQPPDPGHPRFQEIVSNFINLVHIEANLKNNKYATTTVFAVDIDRMF